MSSSSSPPGQYLLPPGSVPDAPLELAVAEVPFAAVDLVAAEGDVRRPLGGAAAVHLCVDRNMATTVKSRYNDQSQFQRRLQIYQCGSWTSLTYPSVRPDGDSGLARGVGPAVLVVFARLLHAALLHVGAVGLLVEGDTVALVALQGGAGI